MKEKRRKWGTSSISLPTCSDQSDNDGEKNPCIVTIIRFPLHWNYFGILRREIQSKSTTFLEGKQWKLLWRCQEISLFLWLWISFDKSCEIWQCGGMAGHPSISLRLNIFTWHVNWKFVIFEIQKGWLIIYILNNLL